MLWDHRGFYRPAVLGVRQSFPKKVTCHLFLKDDEHFQAEKAVYVGTGIQESMGSSGNDKSLSWYSQRYLQGSGGSGMTMRMEGSQKLFYCVWEEAGYELKIKMFSITVKWWFFPVNDSMFLGFVWINYVVLIENNVFPQYGTILQVSITVFMCRCYLKKRC